MQAINFAHAKFALSDVGVGEPVVLVHCSSANKDEWQKLAQSLGVGFRAIALDQWSCGGSDRWFGDGPFALCQEAAPICQKLDELAEATHLLGHSYGGGVALRVVLDRPDQIESLTLIEPSCFHLLKHGDRNDRALFLEIEKVADLVQTGVLTGDYRSGMRRFFDYWNGIGTWDALPPAAQVKMCLRLDKVLLDFKALFDEPAILADYARIGHPTLLVCGELSPNPSKRIVDLLAKTLPNTKVVRVPGAAHMSPMTHPAIVNPPIVDHLQRHKRRPPARREWLGCAANVFVRQSAP